MKTFIKFLPVLLIVLSSCKKAKKQEQLPEDFVIDGNRISLPENSTLRGRLGTGLIKLKDFRKEVQAPASVEANSTKMAKVTPPLVGRIINIYVKLGDTVKPGQVLFTIDSPELAQAQKDYLSAKAEIIQAEINMNRQKDLFDNGVGMKKDVEQTKTNFEVAKSQLKQAEARLKIYNIDPEKTSLGEPLKVYSPIRGRVISMGLAPGEYHNDPNQNLITIADLSSVWITANVREKDIRFLAEGEDAIARISAYPEDRFEGKVLYIDDILDVETRTVKVRVGFDNPQRKMKPGMFASVTFRSKVDKALLIPAKSIIQENDKKFVFLKISDGNFEKREIITDDSDSFQDEIVVTDGIADGDEIITEGTFYLLKMK